MLPKTSLDHYITGITALNIPMPDEGYGDWHFHEAFYGRGNILPKIFMAGTGEECDTNAIFGDNGVYSCEEQLKEIGISITEEKVYAAGHYRAVLDMLYGCLKRGNYPYHIDLSAWFDTPEQINVVLTKAKEMRPFLKFQEMGNLDKWLQSQN
jgi:hypothetical protein